MKKYNYVDHTYTVTCDDCNKKIPDREVYASLKLSTEKEKRHFCARCVTKRVNHSMTLKENINEL